MTATKEQLLSALEKIKSIRILVIGDIILDRYIWGGVERISPEAPVPVVEVKKVEDRLGGAANVVRNLASLGANVSLCGFIGGDDEGKVIMAELQHMRVDCQGVIIDRDRPSALKTRVIAHAQQVVRIDREDRTRPGPALCEGMAAVIDSHIDSQAGVILSDYAKGTVSEAILRKLHEAVASKRLGLGKRPFLLDPHPGNYHLYQRMSIIKANRKETERATGIAITDRNSAELAAQALMNKWKAEMIMVTLGEDGMVIAELEKKGTLFLETRAKQVFDVSGAGDTVAAIFTAALAAGATPMIAGELANIGAGVVIGEIGTAAVSPEKIVAKIEEEMS